MKLSLLIILLFVSNYLYGQYQIPASVFGNAGAVISNSSFRISSTAGQTLIGQGQVSNFNMQVGFWRPAQLLTPVAVEEFNDIIPKEYRLEQNYPNPFNPATTIKYSIKERSFVDLILYDILGREVGVLVSKEQIAGSYEVKLDASNLPSGIYFYRLQAGDFIDTKKMILLK